MRRYLALIWLFVLAGALYIYFFHANFFQNQLQSAFHWSLYLGYAFFLILGCARGFTLIPVTYLIVLGLLFFPPLPLYLLIMGGIIVSSVSVYYFSEFLRMGDLLERKYQKRILKIRAALQKHELPIIIGWSAFPLLPTDIICYVCGSLRINFTKFIIGVIIGEGITSGLYVFFGHYLLHHATIGF